MFFAGKAEVSTVPDAPALADAIVDLSDEPVAGIAGNVDHRGRPSVLTAEAIGFLRADVATMVDGRTPINIETVRETWEATLHAKGLGYLLASEGGSLKMCK